MEQSAQALRQLSQKVRHKSDARAERVIDFLHDLYPQKTAECVEADTGIKTATVRQWMARHSAPSFVATFRLIGAYGPEFICAVMENPPKGLKDLARSEKQQKLEARIEALKAQLERA